MFLHCLQCFFAMITHYVIWTKLRGKTTFKITNTWSTGAVFFTMHRFYVHLFLEPTLHAATETMQSKTEMSTGMENVYTYWYWKVLMVLLIQRRFFKKNSNRRERSEKHEVHDYAQSNDWWRMWHNTKDQQESKAITRSTEGRSLKLTRLDGKWKQAKPYSIE